MHDVADYHKKIGAPFKHWQLDSWWYPKGSGGEGSSGNGKGDFDSIGFANQAIMMFRFTDWFFSQLTQYNAEVQDSLTN